MDHCRGSCLASRVVAGESSLTSHSSDLQHPNPGTVAVHGGLGPQEGGCRLWVRVLLL